MIGHHFHQENYDNSLFINKTHESFALLLVYIDDIAIFGNPMLEFDKIKHMTHNTFQTKNLGQFIPSKDFLYAEENNLWTIILIYGYLVPNLSPFPLIHPTSFIMMLMLSMTFLDIGPWCTWNTRELMEISQFFLSRLVWRSVPTSSDSNSLPINIFQIFYHRKKFKNFIVSKFLKNAFFYLYF